MARVSKTLLRRGIYEAPQGTLRATQSRMQSWVDKFQRMRAEGILVPCAWGHQPDAVPADASERAQRQYWLSALNCGYLADLTLSPDGQLDGKIDAPGVELHDGKLCHWVRMPDGRQLRSAIGEISLAVKDHVDGSGRKWPDSIVHVGLTPLPVAHGHGGFSLSACVDAGAGYTLSLAQYSGTLSAAEGDDVAEDKEDMPKKKEGDSDKGGGGSSDHFKEGMEFLAKRGISLPDDTTSGNFWERLCVAGHALEHAETTTGEDMPPEDMPPEDDMPPEEPEAELTDEDAEAPPMEDATEEQRPVMMSLATTKDPAAKGLVRSKERDHKESLNRRITALVKRGVVGPPLAAELRGKVESYTLGFTLSADGDVEVATKRLDERISDLEQSPISRHPLKGLRTAQEARRPDEQTRRAREQESHRRQEDVGDEIAAMAGAPARKGK